MNLRRIFHGNNAKDSIQPKEGKNLSETKVSPAHAHTQPGCCEWEPGGDPRRHPCLIPRLSAEARGAPGLTLLSAQGVHAVAPQPHWALSHHYPNVLPASPGRGHSAPSPTRAPATASPSWPGSQPARARLPRLSLFHSSFGLFQGTFRSHHITHQNSSKSPTTPCHHLQGTLLLSGSSTSGHRLTPTATSLPRRASSALPSHREMSKLPQGSAHGPFSSHLGPLPLPFGGSTWKQVPPRAGGGPSVCVQLPLPPPSERRWNLKLNKAKAQLRPPPAAPSPCPAVPTPRAAQGRSPGASPRPS